MNKRCWAFLGALPSNPRDLSHCGQRQVAGAGRETLGLQAHCTCLRHRLGAQVASQLCLILRSSVFIISCSCLLCANFCTGLAGILKLLVISLSCWVCNSSAMDRKITPTVRVTVDIERCIAYTPEGCIWHSSRIG